jgi:HlyD family secretion protein
MSALGSPSVAPVQVRPKIVSSPPAPPRWKWPAFCAAIVVVAIIVLVLVRNRSAAPAQPSAAIRTAKVTTGPLERVLRLSGTTSARNFASISAPMMRGPDSGRALILISLAKSGSIVRKGDLVAQIDAQAIRDHVDDIDAQVHQAQSDIRKRMAEQQIEMENLRQNVRLAKANVDKARLDAGAAEIRTSIDRELLKLGVEEAEADYRELQQELAQQQIVHQSEIRILEYTRDRHARHRDRHRNDAEKFTMHAPIGGLVVMQSVWRSGDMGQVQEGDQVSPGQPFMKIVDPSSMQLDAMVSQAQSELLRIGQPATVNLDAFPGLRIHGTVQSIGAIGIGGWRLQYYVRNVPVRVSIEAQDERIIPDLSSSADVVLERVERATLVPGEGIDWKSGKPVVYVRRGAGFEPREIAIASRNAVQAAVLSGVQPGEEIALQVPQVR